MTEDDEKISMEEKEALEEEASIENIERDVSSSKIKRPNKPIFKETETEVIDPLEDQQKGWDNLEEAMCPDCGTHLEFTTDFYNFHFEGLGSSTTPVPDIYRCPSCPYVGDEIRCNPCHGGGYFLLGGYPDEYVPSAKEKEECGNCEGAGTILQSFPEYFYP